MFLGVEYLVDGTPMRVAMDRRDGALPIATRGGGYLRVFMGQGEAFVDESPGHFLGWPEGNTVTLDMLARPSGMWQQWRNSVRPVKIAVARFFYTDVLGYRTQCDLHPGEFLQGALLKKRIFERVYVVVVPQPGTPPEADYWWPRIVVAASHR
jgi:hypothetical protein